MTHMTNNVSPYSIFSTNTRMVPPQESPTCQAVSSATPNSSVLGLPLSITSSASVTTAPSTHPPETEPRKLPSPSMTRFEPTGRGAEPQVSTTVATATLRPSLRQSSAALRMSLSLASIGVSFGRPSARPGEARPRHSMWLRHLLQPSFWIGCHTAALGRQRSDELSHRLQIMDRTQFIHVGKHGPYAFGFGLESREPQQRIEPDQPSAGAVQPVDLEGQPVIG